MRIHHEPLSEITRYLKANQEFSLEDMRPTYEGYLRLIRRFKPVTPETRILEIGTGTGWFPLMAKLDGLSVRGIEISPQLLEFSMEWGRQHGVVPDITLANLEEHPVGESLYDVIVANSVFEHIERWELALGRLAAALKPGGILYFCSTNKFSPISYEYPMLFYGWMPDSMRYRFRMWRAGAEVMKLGIDFNQFRCSELRRAFRRAGFSAIFDRVDLVDTDRLSAWKARLLRAARRSALLKWPILTFCDATVFVCVK